MYYLCILSPNRLKAEFDRQQASASLRLLDDILNILDSPSDAESQSIATLKEERTAQAIARLRLAFGDGDVAVSNILSIAAKIAQGEDSSLWMRLCPVKST